MISIREHPAENLPELLKASDVARALGLSTRSVWRLASADKLPQPVRIGRATRWRKEDIWAWISAGCPTNNSKKPR